MELLPCPFCGCAMRIRSNRDTHKLVGDHTEACIYDDDPIIETPATDEILADIVEAWNRRASPAGAPAVCSPTLTECPRCHNDVKKCDGVFAAPTPPENKALLGAVAEVVWYDPQLSHFPEKPGKIIDGSIAFMESAEIGTKLFAAPVSSVSEDRKDAERLNWLDEQGMIAIGHKGCGEYRYYAGDLFPAIRQVIDQASPASAPEGWKMVGLEDLIKTVLDADAALSRGDKNAALIGVRVASSFVSLIKSHVANRKTLAAPTPPSTEDRKDAERYRWLRDIGNNTWKPMIKRGITATQCDSAIDAGIVAMQEDKP